MHGTKVTTDPEANNTINESTGAIANDSLAAESYRSGGGFSENRDSGPNDVSGSSATWNTTDTSGAYKLDSARDHPSRQDDDGSTEYPEAVGGQGQFSGRHNDGSGGYSGGPSGSSGKYSGSGDSGSGSKYDTTGTFSGSGADSYDADNGSTAPNYALDTTGAFQGTKPKGNNISEGGFEGEGTNYNSGIGTRDDPGRAAVQGFAKQAARADHGSTTQSGPSGNEQPFDALDNNERI